MSLLLRLPQDVFSLLFCEWLDVRDLVSVDAGFCCKFRIVFLERLQRVPSLTIVDIDSFTIEALNWIFLREVPLRNLQLHVGLFDDNKMFIPRMMFSAVRHIELDSFVSQFGDVVRILDSCRSLSSLKCSSCKMFCLLKSELLAKLLICELHFSVCQDQESFLDALQSIELNCHQLKVLRIDGPSYGNRVVTSGTLYANILRSNPDIRDLQLVGCMSDLAAVAQHCVNLRTLTLDVDCIDVFALVRHISNHPQLTFVRVVRSCSFINRVSSSVTFTLVAGNKRLSVVGCCLSEDEKQSVRVLSSGWMIDFGADHRSEID